MDETLTIAAMGAQGDGVADRHGQPVHVPGALPGETVRADVVGSRAVDVEVLTPSPERVVPPCRHFAVCGGCKLQHWADEPYRAWKRQRVVDALARCGLDDAVDALVPGAPGSRRRATFSMLRRPEGVLFGFQQAGSHAVVDIAECHVVVPVLIRARGALKALGRALLPVMGARARPVPVTVTVTETGLDVAVGSGFRLTDEGRQAAIGIALKANLARLTVQGEVLAETRKPTVRFDGIAVPLPPGGFLQASVAAEAAMRERVIAQLSGAKAIADLFSGCGTFALPLSRHAVVHAVEADAAALAALDAGWRMAAGERMRAVTTERRDLFVRPVTVRELGRFDGLVFDPPRAGAEAQARQIAASSVDRVVAVSCEPATLARDLRILVDGGHRIVSLTPFDQFLWSPHVEVVALLERAG